MLDVSTKTRMIERWVARRLTSVQHERAVAHLSRQIFDLTQESHGLGLEYRRLLVRASLVHDVGRCKDDDRHPAIGAEMIEQSWLPLGSAERRALAYLTRYHRGDVPAIGEDRYLQPGDDHRGIRLLLAMLRAADCLDSRSMASPQVQMDWNGQKLVIDCLLPDLSAKARKTFTRRKKFRLLEDLLDCRVKVRVGTMDEAELVA